MAEDKQYVELSGVESKHMTRFCSCNMPPGLLMVCGSLVMTGVNSAVSFFNISLLELIAGRYAVQWVICLVVLIARSTLADQPLRFFGPPGSWHWLLLRGVTYYAFIWLWWETLRLVPIGNAVTIVKLECFVVGICSHLVFGERLTPCWWACCFLALVGVMLVYQPEALFGSHGQNSAGFSGLGMLFNLMTPLVGGVMPILIQMAPGAHFMEVQQSTDFVCGVLCSPLLLVCFGHPSELLVPEVQYGIFCVALLGLVSLCLFTAAFQGGLAGRMSLLSYTEIPAAYFAQFFFFDGKLDLLAIGGTFLILAAALGASLERMK